LRCCKCRVGKGSGAFKAPDPWAASNPWVGRSLYLSISFSLCGVCRGGFMPMVMVVDDGGRETRPYGWDGWRSPRNHHAALHNHRAALRNRCAAPPVTL